MTPELQARIERVRRALAAAPDLIIACDVGPARADASAPPGGLWRPYAELLRVADGARFGAFVLWSSDEYPDQQFRLEPDASRTWLCVGQIDVDPIVLDTRGPVDRR